MPVDTLRNGCNTGQAGGLQSKLLLSHAISHLIFQSKLYEHLLDLQYLLPAKRSVRQYDELLTVRLGQCASPITIQLCVANLVSITINNVPA